MLTFEDTIYKLHANYTEGLHFSAFILVDFEIVDLVGINFSGF